MLVYARILLVVNGGGVLQKVAFFEENKDPSRQL